MKKIILLEFKRTIHTVETYFQDVWKVTEKQHPPILTGLGIGKGDGKRIIGRLGHTLLSFS